MARIRVNTLVGLGSAGAAVPLCPVSTSGDTLTFGSNPGIPTIAGGSYLPMVLEPNTPNAEVVWINGPYTAGATTATGATRNAEATQNGQNSSAEHTNVAWIHAPTVTDLLDCLQVSNNLSDVADAGTTKYNLDIPTPSVADAVAIANVNIASPGATLDGYALQSGDMILLTNQTTGSQNGPWQWNGAAVALTRPNYYPHAGTIKRGRMFLVTSGATFEGTIWYMPAVTTGITVDTTATTWSAVNITGTIPNLAVIKTLSPAQLAALSAAWDIGGQQIFDAAAATQANGLATIGQTAGIQLPYVVSGCVWTANSSGSTLVGSMSAGVVCIKGINLVVNAVVNHTFAASSDTYVDFQDAGNGQANVYYTAVSNNGMSPALGNSGTASNTLRNAIIVTTAGAMTTGANTINQGNGTGATATTAASTTVAAGSNGQAIGALTSSQLVVASNTGFASSGGLAQVDTTAGAGTAFGTLISYTGISGSTILTGVAVIAGNSAATVATGGAVLQIAGWTVSDAIGNPIYPLTGDPGLISERGLVSTAIGTGTAALTVGQLATPFVIPPGIGRRVKVTVQLPALSSAAAAGTQLTIEGTVDGSSVSYAYPKVYVSSDNLFINVVGYTVCAPGLHWACCTVQQAVSAFIGITAGLIPAVLAVELV